MRLPIIIACLTASLITAPVADAMPFAYVSNYNPGTVSVIDTANNTVVATINLGAYVFSVTVNPAGTHVYAANVNSNTNRYIRIIDALTNTEMSDPIAITTIPTDMVVNPTDTLLYVTSGAEGGINPNIVSVIDLINKSLVTTIGVGANPLGIAVNPAGTRIYVANNGDNTVSVIDASSNAVVKTISVGDHPRAIAVNPAGTKVYVTNGHANTISVIDAVNNTVVGSPIAVGSSPTGVAINLAGTRLYVANNSDNTVMAIDTASNSVVATTTVGAMPLGLAVNPAGTRVFVENNGGNSVSVVDTVTSSLVGSAIPVGISPGSYSIFIPQTTSFIKLGGYLSGNWAVPNQGGHGFQLELTNAPGATAGTKAMVAIWFVYTPPGSTLNDGSGQNWIYAQGEFDPTSNTVTLPAILLAGARFPPNFVASDVHRVPSDSALWGHLTFSFSDCNNGAVSWHSDLTGYNLDNDTPLPIQRITQIDGTTCP